MDCSTTARALGLALISDLRALVPPSSAILSIPALAVPPLLQKVTLPLCTAPIKGEKCAPDQTPSKTLRAKPREHVARDIVSRAVPYRVHRVQPNGRAVPSRDTASCIPRKKMIINVIIRLFLLGACGLHRVGGRRRFPPSRCRREGRRVRPPASVASAWLPKPESDRPSGIPCGKQPAAAWPAGGAKVRMLRLIPDLAIAPSQLRLVEWPSASALE